MVRKTRMRLKRNKRKIQRNLKVEEFLEKKNIYVEKLKKINHIQKLKKRVEISFAILFCRSTKFYELIRAYKTPYKKHRKRLHDQCWDARNKENRLIIRDD